MLQLVEPLMEKLNQLMALFGLDKIFLKKNKYNIEQYINKGEQKKLWKTKTIILQN